MERPLAYEHVPVHVSGTKQDWSPLRPPAAERPHYFQNARRPLPLVRHEPVAAVGRMDAVPDPVVRRGAFRRIVEDGLELDEGCLVLPGETADDLLPFADALADLACRSRNAGSGWASCGSSLERTMTISYRGDDNIQRVPADGKPDRMACDIISP